MTPTPTATTATTSSTAPPSLPPTTALTAAPTTAEVLAEIAALLRGLLDEYGLDDAEIGMDTRFHEDLDLESIDLVTLAGRLEERYGSRVNFAEFVADLDLDEIIALTVGRLVDHVAASLRDPEGG